MIKLNYDLSVRGAKIMRDRTKGLMDDLTREMKQGDEVPTKTRECGRAYLVFRKLHEKLSAAIEQHERSEARRLEQATPEPPSIRERREG